VAVVLGVHSNVAGDANGFTDGHAWISVRNGGTVQYYGLWPDSHGSVTDNGDGTDIRTGMEADQTPAASRYYELSEQQAARLNLLLGMNVSWGYTHNCSSWASDVVREVAKQDIDADDWLGIETPRELGRNILRLERKEATSPESPKKPVKSSSFALHPHQGTYHLYVGGRVVNRGGVA